MEQASFTLPGGVVRAELVPHETYLTHCDYEESYECLSKAAVDSIELNATGIGSAVFNVYSDSDGVRGAKLSVSLLSGDGCPLASDATIPRSSLSAAPVTTNSAAPVSSYSEGALLLALQANSREVDARRKYVRACVRVVVVVE